MGKEAVQGSSATEVVEKALKAFVVVVHPTGVGSVIQTLSRAHVAWHGSLTVPVMEGGKKVGTQVGIVYLATDEIKEWLS